MKGIKRLAEQIRQFQAEIDSNAVTEGERGPQNATSSTPSQTQALEACLKACTIALDDVSRRSRGERNVGHAEAFNRSRQIIGNVGDVKPGHPSVTVGCVIGRGDARQIAGGVEGNVALEFMK